MLGREADRFEEALQGPQGAVDERLLPLVQTARMVADLAGTPPPPPHNLLPGRQRFLTEAAQLQSESHDLRRVPLLGTPLILGAGIGRLAAVLAAVILALGLVFTAGTATAKSLPGEPLYGLKLAAEQARMVLTVDPQADLDLSLTLAEERLEEIVAQMEQGQAPEPVTVTRLDQHLMAVLEAASQVEDPETVDSLQRLERSLQQQVRTTMRVMEGMPGQEQVQLRELVRVMERIRLEAQAGQEDPAGLRLRLRQGVPLEPEILPGASRTPGGSPQPQPGGARATERAESSPSPSAAPCETCDSQDPGHASPGTGGTDGHPQGRPGQPGGPVETAEPDSGLPPRVTEDTGGVSPTEEPGSGPGPRHTDQPRDSGSAEPPGPGHDSGAQPTQTPVEPGATEKPDQGSQPQPTGQQGDPDPKDEPGSGPGPQATDAPGDPDPPGPPEPGDDSPPPAGGGEPDPPEPPGTGTDSPGTGNGKGDGKGKP